jgi:hypothetical protein
MKPLNKRVNKKKASKVTLKNRRSQHRLADNVEKELTSGLTSIRPEDVKLHQHY